MATLANQTPTTISNSIEPIFMTEAEFAQWSMQADRVEWVDGKVIFMSPVSLKHVQIASFLVRFMGAYVEHHDLGQVLGPEYQMRIEKIKRRRVPDVLFVSKARFDMLKANHIEGVPDLVVEIASPDSVARDWREKYWEYEVAGVPEYWVIDPMAQRMEAYTLGEDGKYSRLPEQDGTIYSQAVSGFCLKPDWLWQEQLPRSLDLLKEMDII